MKTVELITPEVRAMLSPDARQFLDAAAQTSARFCADFREHPKPDMNKEAIEAYCDGFTEAAAMYSAVLALRTAR